MVGGRLLLKICYNIESQKNAFDVVEFHEIKNINRFIMYER